jgi:hypothetical protein
MKKLSLICVALLLSACGGGGGDGGGPVATPGPAPTPSPMADEFYARLIGIVNSAPDDTEPGDVSMIVPNEPEDSEPPGL